MLYCKKFTFARQKDTPDQSYAVLANIGQQAMPQAINQMEIEVPLLIYSNLFHSVIDGKVKDQETCKTFYQQSFGFKSEQAGLLCMDDKDPQNLLNITTFNFYSDPVRTSKAWVSLYMFNVSADPSLLADMLYLLNTDTKTISDWLFSSKTLVTTFMKEQVFKPIYTHYQNSSCTG